MNFLLLFGRLPQLGKVKTRLAAGLNHDGRGKERTLKIYSAMLADALVMGARGPFGRRIFFYDRGEQYEGDLKPGDFELPLDRWETLPQEGNDLGERLKNGMMRAFAVGAKSVTIYGTDHPLLNHAQLHDVGRWAFNGHLGILPATDGGYAALALPQSLPSLFDDIPWSTPAVFETTLARIKALDYPFKREVATPDIDTAADWLALQDRAEHCGERTRAVLAEVLPPPPGETPTVSVIVPVFNESRNLHTLIPHLRGLGADEVICVDGGSTDGGADSLRLAGLTVLEAKRGRAAQMNAGALAARGDILLFLHADTHLPASWRDAVLESIRLYPAGRFDVRVRTAVRDYPLLSRFINLHSYFKGVATGDQAIFLTRRFFWQLGGFPDQPILEDVELCRRMRRHGECINAIAGPVITSGRRWETRGFWKTVLLMWKIRWLYWTGTPAAELAEMYR